MSGLWCDSTSHRWLCTLTPLVPLIGTGSFHHLSSAQHSTGCPLRSARRTAFPSLRKQGRCLFAMPLEATTATKEQVPDTLAGAPAASKCLYQSNSSKAASYQVQHPPGPSAGLPVRWVCTASDRASPAGGKQAAGKTCAGSEHLVQHSQSPCRLWPRGLGAAAGPRASWLVAMLWSSRARNLKGEGFVWVELLLRYPGTACREGGAALHPR